MGLRRVERVRGDRDGRVAGADLDDRVDGESEQFTATQSDGSLTSATQRLNLVTSELQESVMKTRMQPIGNVWSKFPRIVRDLAVLCSKQVRIEMEGKDTELDKTIIEAQQKLIDREPERPMLGTSLDAGPTHFRKMVAARAGSG